MQPHRRVSLCSSRRRLGIAALAVPKKSGISNVVRNLNAKATGEGRTGGRLHNWLTYTLFSTGSAFALPIANQVAERLEGIVCVVSRLWRRRSGLI